MIDRKKFSRREFARLVSSATAATMVAPLGLLSARTALGTNCQPGSFAVPGFGQIRPLLPDNHESLRVVAETDWLTRNLSSTPLLALPSGFRYTAISLRGYPMSDGLPVPGNHDGMACFAGPGDHFTLVRNHELSITDEFAGNRLGCLAPDGKRFDEFTDAGVGLGGGGTTTVIVNRNGRKVRDYVSLGGTIRNCAGGATPWNTWISCEEDVSTPALNPYSTRKHGYTFEVPANLDSAVEPVPMVAMGRMNHEAVSVDARSGNVYQTEDRHNAAYYRFVPHQKPGAFGDLQRGGDLYAMVIDPSQRADCDNSPLPTSDSNGSSVVDTRGVSRGGPASMLAFLGQPLKVNWVKLEDVDPQDDTLRLEAQAKGAAVFWRNEGATYADGYHYFVGSGAGDAGEGQVWRYDEHNDTITLLLESTSESLLDGPDNITAGPDGTLYLCEDGSTGFPGLAHHGQRLIGVDKSGGLFTFAKNLLDTSEFAGVCFSPDGRYLFVNSQGAGITYAIWRENGGVIQLA